MASEKNIAMLSILIASMVTGSLATLQANEQECADQLTNLAACIPFVSGTANTPTTECCQNTQKIKANKPKCLCVLIKESTDPSMGLPVNTTLALQMPSACNIDAKVSDCPSIMNLPPDSPDAKIFKEAGSSSDFGTTSSSSSKDSPPSSDSKATPTPTPSSSNGRKNRNQLFEVGIIMTLAAWILI